MYLIFGKNYFLKLKAPFLSLAKIGYFFMNLLVGILCWRLGYDIIPELVIGCIMIFPKLLLIFNLNIRK